MQATLHAAQAINCALGNLRLFSCFSINGFSLGDRSRHNHDNRYLPAGPPVYDYQNRARLSSGHPRAPLLAKASSSRRAYAGTAVNKSRRQSGSDGKVYLCQSSSTSRWLGAWQLVVIVLLILHAICLRRCKSPSRSLLLFRITSSITRHLVSFKSEIGAIRDVHNRDVITQIPG